MKIISLLSLLNIRGDKGGLPKEGESQNLLRARYGVGGRKVLFALMVIPLLLFGCAIAGKTGLTDDASSTFESEYYIKEVPFIAQKADYCGPAALAMVINHYEGQITRQITQDEIASEVFIKDLKGALIWDLQKYAIRKGFKAEVDQLNLESIKEELRNKRPVILLLDEGFSIYTKPHYIVVIGLDEKRRVLVAHSATTPNKIFPYDELLSKWRKMQFMAMKIQK